MDDRAHYCIFGHVYNQYQILTELKFKLHLIELADVHN